MDENYYLGFVMAMMWGGILMQPKKGHKGVKTTSNAYQAFNMHHNTIAHYLSQVKHLIDIGQSKVAYNGLLPGGKFKINGVNESFFTKILCFLSQSLDEPRNLLIYDKWTRLVHLHLMLDNHHDPNEFYTDNEIQDIANAKVVYANNNQRYPAYHHYCHSMNQLADALSDEDHPISPFKLEAFLFGRSLKPGVNKNKHNPRYWYKKNFQDNYLPLFP
jgi:hypothetical protein